MTPDPEMLRRFPRTVAVDLERVRGQVERAAGPDDERARILHLLDQHGGALLERTCRPGHLTGSAFVVSAAGTHTLLLHHTKLKRWLQPGGHADGQDDLAAVALREATEETGIQGLVVSGDAIDLDIHLVEPPHEDAHLHLDVRYLVRAPADAELVGNEESTDLRWVARADLGDYDLDEGLLRMARVGFELAANAPAAPSEGLE